MKKIINTDNAPKAIGPYSQAVKASDFLFISGQLPLDHTTMKIDGETAADQADRAIRNMGSILKEADMGFNNVVKTTVLLSDIADFKSVNEIYAKYFTEDFPARAAYQVANLPLGVKVEIEAIAYDGK